MEAATIFRICNTVVLPVWLLLIVAPRWKVTRAVAGSCAVPVALGVVYAVVAAMHLNLAEADFSTLEGVKRLFANDYIVLIGWAHYLAFDLFIGGWEVRDAERLGIPHLLVIPCLVLTFMLGPVGLVLYFGLRIWKGEYVVGGLPKTATA